MEFFEETIVFLDDSLEGIDETKEFLTKWCDELELTNKNCEKERKSLVDKKYDNSKLMENNAKLIVSSLRQEALRKRFQYHLKYLINICKEKRVEVEKEIQIYNEMVKIIKEKDND